MNRTFLAQELKSRKEELNMTNEDIHRLSGISVATIKRTFSGVHTTMDKVEQIAFSMGVELEVNIHTKLTPVAMRQQHIEAKAKEIVQKILKSSGLELQRPSVKVQKELYNRAVSRLRQSDSKEFWH